MFACVHAYAHVCVHVCILSGTQDFIIHDTLSRYSLLESRTMLRTQVLRQVKMKRWRREMTTQRDSMSLGGLGDPPLEVHC